MDGASGAAGGWRGRLLVLLGLLLWGPGSAWAQEASVPDNPFAEGDESDASTGEPQADEERPAAEEASRPSTEEGAGEDGVASSFAALDPLTKELAEIMDEIVQLRSTIEVLGRQLFATRLRISARREGDAVALEEFTVELDGAPVFRGGSDEVGDGEPSELFTGFAAPGPHRLTLRYRMRATADEAFRYERSETYRFVVPKGALTDVVVELEDDSDIAEEFPEDGEGAFEVRSTLHVERRPLEEVAR